MALSQMSSGSHPMAPTSIGFQAILVWHVSLEHRHRKCSLTKITPRQADSLEHHSMSSFFVMQAPKNVNFFSHRLLYFKRCSGRCVLTQVNCPLSGDHINLLALTRHGRLFWLKEASCVFWLPEVAGRQSVWIPETFRVSMEASESRCTRRLTTRAPHPTGEASHVPLSNAC